MTFSALIFFLNSKSRKKASEVFKTFWGEKYISKEPLMRFITLQLRNCTVGQPMKFWKKGFLRLFWFLSQNHLVKGSLYHRQNYASEYYMIGKNHFSCNQIPFIISISYNRIINYNLLNLSSVAQYRETGIFPAWERPYTVPILKYPNVNKSKINLCHES